MALTLPRPLLFHTENLYCPRPPGAVKCPQRFPIYISLCRSVFYGAFVWARRALNRQKRQFPARAVRTSSYNQTAEWICDGPFSWPEPAQLCGAKTWSEALGAHTNAVQI